MSKAALNLSPEEVEFLEKEKAREAATSTGLPQMKQLAINGNKFDEDGKKIETDTWHIRGEKQYVDSVKFRPLRYVNKFIRMSNSGKAWKIDNESIFVTGFEPAYDIKGTVGCGRVMGNLPDTWTEEQKLANFKKASIYGFLFGLVTFPGGKPELVNFRAAPAKTRVIREALSPKTLGNLKMYQLDYSLDLVPVKDSQYIGLNMAADLKNVHTSFKDIIPYMSEVDKYIEAHNKRIMAARERLAENLKASSTFGEVASLADDFAGEDDLDDVLPLPKA